MIANVFVPYLQYSLVLGAKFVRVLLDNLSLISEPETLNSNNLNLIKHLTSNVWKTPGKNYFWWMCTTVNWCTFQADWRKCLNLKCSYIQQHLLLCRGGGWGGRWGTCCRAAGVNFDDGSQLSGEHSLLCSATLFWSPQPSSTYNIKMCQCCFCM